MNKSQHCNRSGLGAFEDLSQDMERVFDSLLGRTVGNILRPNTDGKFLPSMDVSETKDSFVISLDLPGVKSEDVELEIHDGKLSVSGSRAGLQNAEGDEPKYHRVERNFGKFSRVVALPKDVDTEKVDANFEHGVLLITVPKIAKPQPTKIQIRTS